MPPKVVSANGNVVELIGGPASSTSVGQSVAYLQDTADAECRKLGFNKGQFSGEKSDFFVVSHLFTCVS